MMNVRKRVLLGLTAIVLAVAPQIATAQLDPSIKLYAMEDGVRVAEIFVPLRPADATTYDEHWVLYPKYQYPGLHNLRGLVIKAEPSEAPYADLDDFFRRVPWGPKSKYIHITATESPVKSPIAR